MKLIEFPRYVRHDEYLAVIEAASKKLIDSEDCIAVFQVGGLSSPGISDIDLVAVFTSGAGLPNDPRIGLQPPAAYLFSHNIYGAPLDLFEESHTYTFFHNYRLLAGQPLKTTASRGSDSDRQALMHQSADEYLIRMYINLFVERSLGICKVRNLLLNVKALLYDLEFLGVTNDDIVRRIQQVMEWRETWFSHQPSMRDIRKWHADFWNSFERFLADHFADTGCFLPRAIHQLGRSIRIRAAKDLRANYVGPKLNWVPARWARKSIALAHRLGRFTIEIPYQFGESIPSDIALGFEYGKRAKAYNEAHLPHFMPLTSSLVLP